MNVESYKSIDGLPLQGLFHEDIVRSVLTYKPRRDDVFIATYPKCGATWTQYLILSILTRGNPPRNLADFLLASPYLELMGAEAAEKMTRPGLLKIHLPADKAPYTEDARYIYVARNPYDVCVSFYYHIKAFTPKHVKDVSFARFHELFITGKLSYGDYFDHLLSWYEHRDRPNILFFTYEQMKREPNFWTLKISDFLGEEYGSELRSDRGLFEKVLDATSVRNMKALFGDILSKIFTELLSLPPEKALKSVQVYRDSQSVGKEMHEGGCFVRKGVVGDWKAHFTPELIAKTKQWIQRKTEGSDVMHLWSDIELP
uniref:Putative sulfotransferase n=1 Tax=Amblyomma aureolatum TaxID=187763 RepID=A0A1E1XED8_9ACAR